MKSVLAVLILCVFLQDSDAASCLKYTTSYYFGWEYTYSTYVYCSYGCCGTAYSRTCCSSWTDYYSGYSSYSGYWNIGAIVGAAIGGFIGLCVLICLIVICAKAANKSGSHGRVVRPVHYSSHNASVAVTSGPPPPYTGPGIPQPPPYAGPSGYSHPPSSTEAPGYNPPPNYAGSTVQHPPPNAIPGQPNEQGKY